MTSIAEIRQKYPQYQDMSDEALAGALHAKFYADMPEDEFLSKIGMGANASRERSDMEKLPAGDNIGGGDGIALNTTAGLNSAIYSTLGAPVDLARGAINLGARGLNAATGAEIPTIPSDSIGGSESISRLFGAAGVPEPKDIRAVTAGERIARGAGEGMGYAVAPEAAIAGLAKAGAMTPRVADMAGRMFGRAESAGAVAQNAVAGGASGLGASAAIEAAPDEWKPVAAVAGGMGGGFAGAMAASTPQLALSIGRVAADAAAPLSKTGRQRLAAEQILSSASDPSSVKGTLADLPPELVAGSQPTTFQTTGDMGLGGLERAAQTRRPELFNQRRADQNSARVTALGGVQPAGAPEKVAEAARSFIGAVEQRAAKAYDDATSAARQRAEAIGQGASPESAGTDMRASLEEARAAAKDVESQLWGAVDPDGSLALPAANVRRQVAETFKTLPKSAKPPQGEEAAIYGAVGQYNDVMPFSEITALQSRVKTEMRTERLANGESPAYRRLTQLNSALHADIEAAVSGKMVQEAEAVAKGEMKQEDTLFSRMQTEQQDWYGRRSQATGLGERTGTGTGADASFRQGRVSSTSGNEISGLGGFRGAEGNPGLQKADIQPNFDAGAADRLNAARTATLDRFQTFDNKTLGPIRKRPSTNTPYDMPAASVAARIFSPGAGSTEAIGALRKAVGDDVALQHVETYAVDRMRKVALRDDGTLDPAKLESWRRSHADAMKALPGLDVRLKDASSASALMADVMRRNKATMDEIQRTRLGTLMKLDDPSDVTNVIGGIFQRQDRNTQMGKLASVAARDPEAKQGLRKAVVDHVMKRFIGNTEGATTGQALMKSDQYQAFIKENRGALRLAGFSPDEVELMGKIAADLQQANRSLAAVKIPGQSNTAQDTFRVRQDDAPSTILGRILMGTAATGGFAGGGVAGSVVGVLGAKTASAMRAAGIESVNDIVADAMLNPGRARILLMNYQPRTAASAGAMLSRVYSRTAAPTAGVVAGDALTDRKPGKAHGLPATAAPGSIAKGADGKTYQYAQTSGMLGAEGAYGWIEVNPSAIKRSVH